MSKFTERARRRLEEDIQRRESEKADTARELEWGKRRESENMDQCRTALRDLQAEKFLREIRNDLLNRTGRISQKNEVIGGLQWAGGEFEDEPIYEEEVYEVISILELSWRSKRTPKSVRIEASKYREADADILPKVEISGTHKITYSGGGNFHVGIAYDPNNLGASFQQMKSAEVAEKLVGFIQGIPTNYDFKLSDLF